MVSFVDAAGVDPEVLQAVFPGLIATELDLLVAMLILARAIYQVFEGELLVLWAPSVRQNRIAWDFIVARELFRKTKLASFDT